MRDAGGVRQGDAFAPSLVFVGDRYFPVRVVGLATIDTQLEEFWRVGPKVSRQGSVANRSAGALHALTMHHVINGNAEAGGHTQSSGICPGKSRIVQGTALAKVIHFAEIPVLSLRSTLPIVRDGPVDGSAKAKCALGECPR